MKNLAPGDYVVGFEGRAAEVRAFVASNVGDDASDSDVGPFGMTAKISVAAGAAVRDVDAGSVWEVKAAIHYAASRSLRGQSRHRGTLGEGPELSRYQMFVELASHDRVGENSAPRFHSRA